VTESTVHVYNETIDSLRTRGDASRRGIPGVNVAAQTFPSGGVELGERGLSECQRPGQHSQVNSTICSLQHIFRPAVTVNYVPFTGRDKKRQLPLFKLIASRLFFPAPSGPQGQLPVGPVKLTTNSSAG
jgi:hypothetical protein